MSKYLLFGISIILCHTAQAQLQPASDSSENKETTLREITAASTRSTRTIAHIPTRIEVIGADELDDNSNRRPGDILTLFNERTGIRTQLTSVLSGNASIRIQGLDGRYTQLLKDGLPLYAGAAAGLGLLQTPPLDLRQVEIIKGATSTLYGDGAVAGLVNLITCTPDDGEGLRLLLNATSARGLDMSGFYAKRGTKTGFTLFAARHSTAPYDPADIGWSAIPKAERYTLHPRLFVYFNRHTRLNVGLNATIETRMGGDMPYLDGHSATASPWFEQHRTQRFSTQFTLEHQFSDRAKITLRNSYTHFWRMITIPDYIFNGVQNASFSEINYSCTGTRTEWVAGLDLRTDAFTESRPNNDRIPLDDSRLTTGIFIQNLTRIAHWLSLEAGLRGDCVKGYGIILLPRLAALFKIGRRWTSRIGGGMGYKTPTVFTDESELIHYRRILPIAGHPYRTERSYSANVDIGYHTVIAEKLTVSINRLFFYTRLTHPLTLLPQADGTFQFQHLNGHIDTRGGEGNLKIGYNEWRFSFGYTFTDVVTFENSRRRPTPLTPQHRLRLALMYDADDRWRAGLEASYTSPQQLAGDATGQDYWTFSAMLERIWPHFSLFIHFENITDTRQTRFGHIYTGTANKPPAFGEIYAPPDGFVMNGGVKIRL
ncbi:MAG: TonB-dependent receptor plug domain-containing protein [Prevotellaceae bacterium]|jgi:iron complex outermembrane receptor protein|nr:TonB-dependent receptor plug domain-containing protein [Prevotellaceae bacterium]